MEAKQNGKGGLSREQILAAVDLRIESVEVPEWGGTVYVRNLTGTTRDQFEGSRYRVKGREVEIIHDNTRAALLAATICNKEGVRLFTAKDIEALGEKNGAILDQLFEVAQRLSGMRKEDAEIRAKN